MLLKSVFWKQILVSKAVPKAQPPPDFGEGQGLLGKGMEWSGWGDWGYIKPGISTLTHPNQGEFEVTLDNGTDS